MGRPGPWSYPARYQEGRVGGGVPQSSASTALWPQHPTPVLRGSGVWEATPKTATRGHLPPNSRLPGTGGRRRNHKQHSKQEQWPTSVTRSNELDL